MLSRAWASRLPSRVPIPPLKPAPVTITIPIHWGDMDALGHVNNVLFFRYLESARVAYIQALGLSSLREIRPADGSPAVGFILQHAQCRFRRPVIYPDTLRVTARLQSIESDRFSLEHEIISDSQRDVAALGTGTIVTYDYTQQTKTPMPDEIRLAIERLERKAT